MAKDYKDIGLNERLQKIGSLPDKRSGFTTASDFDMNYEGVRAINVTGSDNVRTENIVRSGTSQIIIVPQADGCAGTSLITHNLGYIPKVEAFMESVVGLPNSRAPIPFEDRGHACVGTDCSFDLRFSVDYTVNGTALEIVSLNSTSFAGTYAVKYNLYKESATDSRN